MADKIAKCKLFPRHQWGWVKNVWLHHVTTRSARASKRGVYRCDCGEAKFGQPNLATNQEG